MLGIFAEFIASLGRYGRCGAGNCYCWWITRRLVSGLEDFVVMDLNSYYRTGVCVGRELIGFVGVVNFFYI